MHNDIHSERVAAGAYQQGRGPPEVCCQDNGAGGHCFISLSRRSSPVQDEVCQAKETCSRAVEDAIARARKCFENSEIKRVKCPDGRIEDWVCDLVVDTYRLAAVIYGNAHHFVARLSTPLGMWWYYDGMINDGQPVVDTIAREEDLIVCGGGYTMNALVYCLT